MATVYDLDSDSTSSIGVPAAPLGQHICAEDIDTTFGSQSYGSKEGRWYMWFRTQIVSEHMATYAQPAGKKTAMPISNSSRTWKLLPPDVTQRDTQRVAALSLFF